MIKHILLIEAETETVRLIQQAFLSEASHIWLEWVSSLQEARQKLVGWSPDLLITAAELPDGSGEMFAEKEIGLTAYPVIILSKTARPVEYTLEDGLGIRDYLAKVPTNLTALPELVKWVWRSWDQFVRRRQVEAVKQQMEAELQAFQAWLKALHEIIIQLTDAESFDQLCRLTVELGRSQLGFDRARLWLIDETDRNRALGTFGTDEQGQIRDERMVSIPLEPLDGGDDPMLWEILREGRSLTYQENYPLFNERLETVGSGWSAVAALWDGSQVVGFFCADNLLNQQPVSPHQLELLILYGSTLGHMISRFRAAARLRESEALFRRLFDGAPIAMALTTLDGYLVQVNPAFCQTVGYTVEELIGLNFERLVHADDLPAGLALVEQLVRGEITFFQVEKRYIAKDRQIIHVLLHATLRSDAEGQPINLIRQIVDITDQKRVETQLIDSLKEKEILLKEIHHRVKNNLQVISSLLALQSHYSAEVYTREMMQESQNRVRSMALVHEQLYQDQDLTNIDCARYLRTLIEHLERAYQPQAGTVNLNIEVAEVLLNIDQAIPCGLIVNELVSNALKHAFPGGQDGQIHVQLRTNEAKTIARLTVADTGVGLPLAIDFKATDSLGLQLVNILTRQLSGSVELDRSQGTAFTVEFLIGGADSEHS